MTLATGFATVLNMIVFTVWDNRDYYGPDPMEPDHIFASLDTAKQAVEAAAAEDPWHSSMPAPEWKQWDEDNWEYHEFTVHRDRVIE